MVIRAWGSHPYRATHFVVFRFVQEPLEAARIFRRQRRQCQLRILTRTLLVKGTDKKNHQFLTPSPELAPLFAFLFFWGPLFSTKQARKTNIYIYIYTKIFGWGSNSSLDTEPALIFFGCQVRGWLVAGGGLSGFARTLEARAVRA